MKTWARLYTDILDDYDQSTLTWAQRGIWAALLALARRIDDRDAAGKKTGRLDTGERVAWALRCSEPDLNDAVAAFTARGMVEIDEDGILWLPDYARGLGRTGRTGIPNAARLRRQRQGFVI